MGLVPAVLVTSPVNAAVCAVGSVPEDILEAFVVSVEQLAAPFDKFPQVGRESVATPPELIADTKLLDTAPPPVIDAQRSCN